MHYQLFISKFSRIERYIGSQKYIRIDILPYKREEMRYSNDDPQDAFEKHELLERTQLYIGYNEIDTVVKR